MRFISFCKRLLLLSVLLSQQAMAQEEKEAVVVWNGNTEVMSFFVEDEPQLFVVDGYVHLKADGTFKDWFSEYEYNEVEYRYLFPVSGKFRMTLEKRGYYGYWKDNETGIKDVAVAKDNIKPAFQISNGQLAIWGVKPNTDVCLYDMGGRMINKAKVGGNGSLQIELPKTKGVILVKTNAVSFKITVK